MFAVVVAQLMHEYLEPDSEPPHSELANSVFRRVGELRDWVVDPDGEPKPTPDEISALDAMLSSFVGVFNARCGIPPPAPTRSLN